MVKEELSWGKVYMWELSAYGAGGRWGLPPPPAPAAASYRQLLGLNGIWGFGSGSFSDTLVKQGLGPLLYSPVASSGRNYHSMSWDVNKPGDDPRYDTMNKVRLWPSIDWGESSGCLQTLTLATGCVLWLSANHRRARARCGGLTGHANTALGSALACLWPSRFSSPRRLSRRPRGQTPTASRTRWASSLLATLDPPLARAMWRALRLATSHVSVGHADCLCGLQHEAVCSSEADMWPAVVPTTATATATTAGDYTPSFYQLLLRGFIEGVAAGDPAIKRLPCALQVGVAAVSPSITHAHVP
jgi:hypothetical protein